MFTSIKVTSTEMAVQTLTEVFSTEVPTFADIETENFYYGWRTIQVYQPDTVPNVVYVIDLDYCDREAIKEALKPLWTVWYGASYDFGTLNMTTARYDDLMLAVRTAYYKLPAFDLATATRELVPLDLYEGLDKKELQKQGFKLGTTLTEEQIRYASADVVALSYLWKLPKVQAVIKDALFYKVDMLTLGYVIQFQQNGAISHMPSVEKELKLVEAKILEEEALLEGINANSYKQVRAYLSNLLGIEVTKSDGAYMIHLMTEYQGTRVAEFAKAVYDNKRSKLRRTNLNKLNKPKVFTKFNPYGAATGRFSSSGKIGREAQKKPEGINFQNVTRDLQYILTQDTEDTVVVHADYSTAELRAACSIMGDEQMRQYLLKGIDLHKVSAMMADTTIQSIDDVTKEQRQKGKAISFGFIFGMSADRFKEYAYTEYGVIFTAEEAKAVRTKYLTTYKDIARYHKTKWNNYKTVPVESPMGRYNMPRLGTDAINYGTQASVGELSKLAIHYLCKEHLEAVKYLYSQAHDAIYLRVPKEDGTLWGTRLATAMLKAWDEMLKLSMFKFKDIPMGVEVEVGDEVHEIFNIKDLKWER
jgi:DNA polymerase I-like protein with 3'-5' exonuclease and polymerase domains